MRSKTAPDFMLTPSEFFNEVLTSAFEERRIKTFPLVKNYLVELLQHYMSSDNLYNQEQDGKKSIDTLAELYLKACNEEKPGLKVQMFKKLADTSLYISGFFGDSLKRKVVDIDYYADIGGTAYSRLSDHVAEKSYAKVYSEFSIKFIDYVDVLSVVSQKAQIQSSTDLLRLFDKYTATGSGLAKDQLVEKGLLTHESLKKVVKQ